MTGNLIRYLPPQGLDFSVPRATMPVERHRSPVTITTVPRSTLAHARHKEIDGILKNLRLCSRRLKLALDAFEDELRTLERLYYKCKNQHRTALFFKRVSEMRRYGRRLSELDILECFDLLRASFVGLGHTSNHKALRGSWGHVPEKPYVYFLTERLTACSTLTCKMQERLEKAYHHFALAMQTGAFVQLIILFVAISSRMSVLSSELEEVLHLSVLACNRLLLVIDPTSTHTTTSQQSPPDVVYDVRLEDTAQPVSCCEPGVDTSTPVIEDLSMKVGASSEMRVTPPSSHPANVGKHTTPQTSRTTTAKATQKSRIKKAKKKFDEIDVIFGF